MSCVSHHVSYSHYHHTVPSGIPVVWSTNKPISQISPRKSLKPLAFVKFWISSMGSASLQPSHMKVVFFSKVLKAPFHPPWASLQIPLLSPHHHFICKSPASSSFMPTGKNTQLLYPCCYLPVSHSSPLIYTEDVNFWLALITHNDSNINTDDPLSSLASQFLDLLTPIRLHFGHFLQRVHSTLVYAKMPHP